MFSDKLSPRTLADDARLQSEPRRIGELMPAVLAHYGIEMDPDQAEPDSAIVVFLPTIGDFAIGASELLAAR
jgi:hypothetical protein